MQIKASLLVNSTPLNTTEPPAALPSPQPTSSHGTVLQNNELISHVRTITPSNDVLLVIASTESNVPRSTSLTLADDIAKAYLHHSQTSVSQTYSFKPEFDKIVKQHQQRFDDSITKSIQVDLDQSRDIMTHNLEQAMERGERMSLLVDKTDRLNYRSIGFRGASTRVKRKQWWQNVKWWACLVVAFIVALVIVYFLVK